MRKIPLSIKNALNAADLSDPVDRIVFADMCEDYGDPYLASALRWRGPLLRMGDFLGVAVFRTDWTVVPDGLPYVALEPCRPMVTIARGWFCDGEETVSYSLRENVGETSRHWDDVYQFAMRWPGLLCYRAFDPILYRLRRDHFLTKIRHGRMETTADYVTYGVKEEQERRQSLGLTVGRLWYMEGYHFAAQGLADSLWSNGFLPAVDFSISDRHDSYRVCSSGWLAPTIEARDGVLRDFRIDGRIK